MTRMSKGGCVVLAAVAAGCLAAITDVSATHAQGSAAPSITVEGCVSRAVQNGSLAGQAGVPPATPATAPVLANSNEPTGAFLLNAVSTASAGEPAATIGRGAADRHATSVADGTYVLEGTTQELERHVGRHAIVTGTVVVVDEGPPSAKTPVKHVRVTSIRTLAPACRKATNKNPQ
jgi:hypothetical protein